MLCQGLGGVGDRQKARRKGSTTGGRRLGQAFEQAQQPIAAIALHFGLDLALQFSQALPGYTSRLCNGLIDLCAVPSAISKE